MLSWGVLGQTSTACHNEIANTQAQTVLAQLGIAGRLQRSWDDWDDGIKTETVYLASCFQNGS